jgi:hypothetical protein
MRHKHFALAITTVACAAGAQTSSSSTVSATSTATANGQATASAATFRCGGVGEEDQQRIKAEAGRHDLLVTFAAAGGAYMADVDVQIRRGTQVVLQGRCNGPLMLVDLAPKGTYEISATAEGKTQRQQVTVGGKPASIVMRWPG